MEILRTGFGLIVLSLSLMMIARKITLSGGTPLQHWNTLVVEGLIIMAIGLVVVLTGIFCVTSDDGGQIIKTSGVSVMSLGVAWVLDGTVRSRLATIKQIRYGGWLAFLLGAIFIAVSIWRLWPS